MDETSSPITTTLAGYTDVFLVFLGQALIVFVVTAENAPAFLIAPALALNAVGLGMRAKKCGLGVILWGLIGCLFPVIVPVVGILFMVFRHRKGPREKRPLPLWGHITIGAILFLAGAVLMDSFSFAFFSTIAAVIWALAGRRGLYTKKQRLFQVMIYLAAFAMVLGAKTANNRMSERNANIIIAACDEYFKKNGAYPESLKDLVPAYLPKVPAARYTWISPDFRYRTVRMESGKSYTLTYVVEAPFARRSYNSEQKTWHSID